ncbi:MAG TPA: Fic/DOC family N-terminal domain-containing protein, partial [Steroidobacteraceae bacterium]|nr:Fic/DOC family N-terminal domain-containing protein [Steroidobacteraceae bacterium]
MARSSGTYISTTSSGEEVRAFIPAPLPVTPAIELPISRSAAAEAAIGNLDLVAQMVPSLDWFLYAFVRKEAVLSSQIEGTQATLADLFE